MLTAAPPTVPVAATERMDVLDVLPGIAVLGILLVNVESFIGFVLLARVPVRRAIHDAGNPVPEMI